MLAAIANLYILYAAVQLDQTPCADVHQSDPAVCMYLLEFVFLHKHRCLPPFWCHIVLYIQQPFILTNEIPREITQKVYKQELLFLRFARPLMLIDIHIKFREDILNDFQVIEGTHVFDRQSSKGNNSKSINQELWFFCAARRQMLIDIYMKLLQDILNRFKLQSGHYFVMDKVPREITQKV